MYTTLSRVKKRQRVGSHSLFPGSCVPQQQRPLPSPNGLLNHKLIYKNAKDFGRGHNLPSSLLVAIPESFFIQEKN